MNIDTLILLSIVIALVYYLFIEFFSVIFRLTGLSKSKAKFQVISLLTNSGFTTQEAELIMNSRIRRKLASFTMFFGYLLTVAVISMLVNVFMTLSNSASQDVWRFVIILSGFIVLLFIVSRIKFVDNIIRKMTERIAVKLLFGKKTNVIEVLDNYDQNVIAEVYVTYLPPLCDGLTLAQSEIKLKHGIQVLAIKRANVVKTEINGDDQILQGDLVVIFGKSKNIKNVFLRIPDNDEEE